MPGGAQTESGASAAFKLWKRGQKLGEGTLGEVYIATPTASQRCTAYRSYMASAQLRHWSASLEDSAFHAGASQSTAD